MNRDLRLLTLSLLLWGLGEGLFFHIQPLYMEHLGATPVQVGGLLSALSVVTTVAYLPAGALADRLPRKLMMLGAWVVGIVATLLFASARTWQDLVPAVLLYGSSGYCIPVINAYLAHSVGGRNLERTYTTVIAGYTVGGVISPTVGGALAQLTTMRTVFYVSVALFILSAVVLAMVSPQAVCRRRDGGKRWGALANPRFLRFAALACLMFVAMYIAFPLTPSFLANVRGWDTARVGMMGSFQALGMTLLTLLLGRLSDGKGVRGLVIGQALVWCSALLLARTAAVPVLALAYLLRGAYQGCRTLIQARAPKMGNGDDRGLLLGATETTVAVAQVVAPYAAGWLYAIDPVRPLHVSLALIPLGVLLTVVGLPKPDGK
jgi:MFS family permease